jgi:predicted ArsR family transcriptional regulator
MMDLFAWKPNYPYTAGFKEHSTSKDAAETIEASGRATTLRDRVQAFFDAGHQATADEVAGILKEPFRAVQPRLSELRAKGLIVPTGERRKGSGGGSAHVWRKA